MKAKWFILITAVTLVFSVQYLSAEDDGLLEVKKHFADRERQALNQPFKGVTSDGELQPNLYKISATGVSTQPIVNAATAFLSSLTASQRKKTSFAIDDEEWRKWSNVDNGIYDRQGVSLKEMSPAQKQQAFALMSASLSAKGLQQSKDIMKTDQTLKELNNNSVHMDEQLYFFTIMGKPSQTQPWGWQIDGHHLVINYFVLGNQVVMAPVFMGAEPVVTTSGKYQGNVVLQEEQDLGLALMMSLDKTQRKMATTGHKKGANMQVAANQDNKALAYEGIQVATFNKTQKAALITLIDEYIGNMQDDHAKVKMSEVKSHLDETWFSFKGEVKPDGVFYYRIHSPVLLIEFDHQAPVGVSSPSGSRAATRNHIHTIIRTPNGNDYGKDLLKQHLETHHH